MKPLPKHIEIGRIGESLAKQHLQDKGHILLAQNFHFQKAEIDLITQIGETVVITEVKCRSSNAVLRPEDAINHQKMKLLCLAADSFLATYDCENVRFDVISIIHHNGTFEITHTEDAFHPMDAL